MRDPDSQFVSPLPEKYTTGERSYRDAGMINVAIASPRDRDQLGESSSSADRHE